MKVIIAPDSFKGSLTADEATERMARGVATADPRLEIDRCPIADGGEGFVDTVLSAAGGVRREASVLGPLGGPIEAGWGQLDQHTAVIETASAAGLALVPGDQRDPTRTTTFGLGQLMIHAIEAGCRRLLIGLGGSATNDGGTGMAQALGVRFLDGRAKPIDTPLTGGQLHQIRRIDLATLHPELAQVEVIAACDVTNPLVGPRGASAIYAPQKGASPNQVKLLEAGLVQLAAVCRRDLDIQIDELPGGGAAGGLGAGLVAFASARLSPGIELVLQAVDFKRRVTDCQLCLTGEGRLDSQTDSGKAIGGVARAAGQAGVPTVAIVGSAEAGINDWARQHLLDYRVMADEVGQAESMRNAAETLESCTRRFIEQWLRQHH